MFWKRWRTHPVINRVEARQGYLDRPVLVVPMVSLALVLVAFGLVWTVS